MSIFWFYYPIFSCSASVSLSNINEIENVILQGSL